MFCEDLNMKAIYDIFWLIKLYLAVEFIFHLPLLLAGE